jgi:serine/threonine protein kinase
MYALAEDGSKVMKVTDFGLSVFLEKGATLSEPCGTPNFVAPECWVGGPYGYEVLYMYSQDLCT